jgi:hypothetical protein
MESGEPLLVITEVILGVFGGIFYLNDVLANKSIRIIKIDEIYIIFVSIISVFWTFFGGETGKWLSVKAVLVLLVFTFAVKKTRLSVLMLMVYFVYKILTMIWGGLYLDKLQIIPYGLLGCLISMYWGYSNKTAKTIIVIAALITLGHSYATDFRGGMLMSLISVLVIFSEQSRRTIIRLGAIVPVLYIVIMCLVYLSFYTGDKYFEITASNIERSGMIYTAVKSFFDYPLMGPRFEFDNMVIGSTSIFGYRIYESAKGVDPHSFLLSLWRDEGAVLTLLWFGVWYVLWHKLRVYYLSITCQNYTSYIYLSSLVYSLVYFSLNPPSVDVRLIVGMVFGVAYASLYEKSWQVKEVAA